MIREISIRESEFKPIKDIENLDKLYAEIMESVKRGGLLNAEQISKTQQYFRAYWGTLPPTE